MIEIEIEHRPRRINFYINMEDPSQTSNTELFAPSSMFDWVLHLGSRKNSDTYNWQGTCVQSGL